TRDYLAAAFPELNAWERAGADASSAGMVDAGFENQKELTKMQLDNQKEIAEMQNETQKEIAGIQSATSRQNTKDQVYAQNEILNPLFTINVTMRDIKSKNVYSRVNSKATTQWRKTESANGVHLEGVASDNRSS